MKLGQDAGMKLAKRDESLCGRRRVRRWATGALVLMLTLLTGHGYADYAGDLPTTMGVPELSVQKSPAIIKFQARVSQGKQEVGSTTFSRVYVTVLDTTTGATCTESFSNVQVRNSVLNLTIGRDVQGCDFDEIVKKSNGLSFKVCLNDLSNCLQPIEMGSVPYAIKATYAHHASEAEIANVAAQAHYAHRITADASLLSPDGGAGGEVGKGYFDFHTPATGGTAFPSGGFDDFKDGGFMQWAPVRTNPSQGSPATLAICAKEPQTDGSEGPAPLGRLLLVSDETKMTGAAEIASDVTVGGHQTVVDGLSVGKIGTGFGLTVTQGASIAGGLGVTGASSFKQNTTFGEAGGVNATTMTIHSKAVHKGEVSLEGRVTTALPITGVVAANDIATSHLKDRAVTNSKLAIVPANPSGDASGFRFCTTTDPLVSNPISGQWQFCALNEVQVFGEGGRCWVRGTLDAGSGKYTWSLALVKAGTCCSVNCF